MEATSDGEIGFKVLNDLEEFGLDDFGLDKFKLKVVTLVLFASETRCVFRATCLAIEGTD